MDRHILVFKLSGIIKLVFTTNGLNFSSKIVRLDYIFLLSLFSAHVEVHTKGSLHLEIETKGSFHLEIETKESFHLDI